MLPEGGHREEPIRFYTQQHDYNLPLIGKKFACKTNREGASERFAYRLAWSGWSSRTGTIPRAPPNNTSGIDSASQNSYCSVVKTTVNIPDRELEDAIRFTKAKTKREAIVGAVADFNRRMRMLELAKYAGTCTDLITPQELRAARRRG